MAASAATTLARIGICLAGAAAAACAVAQTPALQNAKPGAAAAAPGGSAGAVDSAKMAKGKQVFTDYSCGSCHALSDAGGDGHVGPSLDGNTGLTEALVSDRVANGQGPMPAFGGQLSAEEIAAVSHYVVHAKK